jgi:hypothetical protein
MRLVYVPEELAPLHLAAWRDVPLLLQEPFDQARRHVERGDRTAAHTFIDRVHATAWGKRDRATAGLGRLYKAEVFRRQHRWENSLEAVRQASTWLRQQVTEVAHYNEGVAAYLEGLVHFTLRADEKVLQAFGRAQELLVEGEKYWGFVDNSDRVADCVDVTHWIARLLKVQATLPQEETIVLLPVYEPVNRNLVRTDIVILSPLAVTLPVEGLAPHLPDRYVPLGPLPISLLHLNPTAQYRAIRIPEDRHLVERSRAGDLLVLRTTVPASDVEEEGVHRTYPFTRRNDGRVVFHPAQQVGRGWVGVPLMLIREEEQ